jgi:hypothetical protein
LVQYIKLYYNFGVMTILRHLNRCPKVKTNFATYPKSVNLPLLLSEACLNHNFFVFRDRSMIFGMWVHDHKAVCRVSQWPSHEDHYGMWHTALWSCTHIPNIIDLSGKTKKLWSGQALLRRSGRKNQTKTICLPSFEKTDCHNIAVILLKAVSNTHNSYPIILFYHFQWS